MKKRLPLLTRLQTGALRIAQFFLMLLVLSKMWMPLHASEERIGRQAPPLQLTGLLQSPLGMLTGQDFKGYVTVLEFWATWCGPCIAAFPRLNALVETFEGQPVRFVSITNEEKETVEVFLGKHSLKTWIGFDDDGQTFESYGVKLIPETVVIGPDGRIAATTHPDHLSEEAIHTLLAGGRVDLPVKSNRVADLQWDQPGSGDITPALAQVVVKPSDADGGAYRFTPGSGHIVADGASAAVLFQLAYDVANHSIDWRAPRSDRVYRASVLAPAGRDDLARSMLAALIEPVLGLRSHWEQRESEVVVLGRKSGAPGPAESPFGEEESTFFRSGEARLKAVTLDQLSDYLSGISFQRPVLNETGLKGRFNIELKWIPGDRASLQDALAEIGLTAYIERRAVPVLVVEPVH